MSEKEEHRDRQGVSITLSNSLLQTSTIPRKPTWRDFETAIIYNIEIANRIEKLVLHVSNVKDGEVTDNTT